MVLTPQQKMEIALALDGLGVGRIEAGFPRVSAEDAEAFGLIAKAGLKAEIWGFGRALKADIDELLGLGAHATVIETPTSAIKLLCGKAGPWRANFIFRKLLSHFLLIWWELRARLYLAKRAELTALRSKPRSWALR